MTIELTPSWVLTTEHPASRHFVPVLLHRPSGATFGPDDTVMLPRNMGGPQPARVFVATLAKLLPADQQEEVKKFVEQYPAS